MPNNLVFIVKCKERDKGGVFSPFKEVAWVRIPEAICGGSGLCSCESSIFLPVFSFSPLSSNTNISSSKDAFAGVLPLNCCLFFYHELFISGNKENNYMKF